MEFKNLHTEGECSSTGVIHGADKKNLTDEEIKKIYEMNEKRRGGDSDLDQTVFIAVNRHLCLKTEKVDGFIDSVNERIEQLIKNGFIVPQPEPPRVEFETVEERQPIYGLRPKLGFDKEDGRDFLGNCKAVPQEIFVERAVSVRVARPQKTENEAS